MSGKILVVDELAANRIVLKAKLSAAYYDVQHAVNGRDALELFGEEQPDLVLASSCLSDLPGPEFVSKLHACDSKATTPIVMLMPDDTPSERIAALEGGANDVIARPIPDPLLLARLRCLLRQQHADHDLSLHSGAARALGFDEQQGSFTYRGRIALVAQPGRSSAKLQAFLQQEGNHDISAVSAECALRLPGTGCTPDVFVLPIAAQDAETSLRLMAELNAAPQTRHCPVVAVLDSSCENLAAILLDMGANDTLTSSMHPREFQIRITRQIRNKQNADRQRHQLRNGLNAALLDPLTGIYNRRYALPYLNRLIDTCTREYRGFVMMVVDLDHFKSVNDRFGHAVGDDVLKKVAQLLSNNIGEEGLVARIGGEEFLIAIPDVCQGEARHIADRLCRIVQKTPVRVCQREAPIYVTISIGVTFRGADDTDPETVDQLLDQADRALYKSKADGRNTVTLRARPAA